MAIPIDPHTVFINNENGNPEDLTFYAELVVSKRNRLGTSSSDKPLVISFLGKGKDGLFTTDWTDNKENFGIKSIDVKMTASYVPQVDIVFEDVRGQALFNNFNESKYRVIFDMPPPIFDLTIKGYYGQPVTYRLHLIKQSTKFVNNNSFEISANFVGMTFAPLADIYVDYIEVAPYLNGIQEDNSGIITYLDLVEKSKQLSNEIKSLTEKDRELVDKTKTEISEIKPLQGNFINNFINEIKVIIDGDSTYGIEKDSADIVTITYYPPNTLQKPNVEIFEKIKKNIDDKIFFFEKNSLKPTIITPLQTPDYNIYDNINRGQNNQSFNIVVPTTSSGIIPPKVIYKINLSDIQADISKVIIEKEDLTLKTNQKMDTEITGVQNKILPGGPTLDKILRIIMNGGRTFFMALKSVVEEAEKTRAGNKDTSDGDAPEFAFPNFYINGPDNKRVKSIPTKEEWPEVQFVNNYINGKMLAEAEKLAQKDNYFDAEGSDYKYVPINAFDSKLDGSELYNSISETNDINIVIDSIVKRGAVLLNMSVYTNNSTNDIFKSYAKLEANNLILAFKKNEKLLDVFINKIKDDSFKFQDSNEIPFTLAIKNKSVKTIAGASKIAIYSFSDNFKIMKPEDFTSVTGGVPTLMSSDSISNENIKKLNDDLIKNYELVTSAISSFVLKNNGHLCQYNIPLFRDRALIEAGFKNRTEYFRSLTSTKVGNVTAIPELFYTNRDIKLSSSTSADDFLYKLFIDRKTPTLSGFEYLDTPFDISYLQRGTGIIEIPKIILIGWGYLLLNASNINKDLDKWVQLPEKVKTAFKTYYNEFKVYFTKNVMDTFNSEIKKLEDGGDKDTFYLTDFIKNITESQYIFVGDGFVMRPHDKITKHYVFDKLYANNYFDTLKTELLNLKTGVKEELRVQRAAITSMVNNSDLKTELYYNFKSFVDKWMLNTPVNVNQMFTGDSDILENFLMVDRGFNNIGERVMLDLKPIYSTETTPDTSLYTLLLNLLSKNNFEFFALPSYISYGDSGVLWNQGNINEVFGTHSVKNYMNSPKFICMYVGGTSSQLDISLPGGGSSHGDDSSSIEEISDLGNNVQSFAVDIGTGNQSFFHGLELDQLEFKETNESIVILDNIAKSDVNTSQTMGNSLFNVYEQRSYTATLNMMGCMMIQPTMYFDLRNVAMFKGTYLILEVSHSVTANNISTTFKGVRIPKISKPYIMDNNIYMNIDGSTINRGGNYSPTRSGPKLKIASPEFKNIINGIGKIKTTGLSNKQKALLDVISYAEGTLGWGEHNGYDCIVTFKPIPAWNENYSEGHGLMSWFKKAADSTAAGRYQFISNSWLGISTTKNGTKNIPVVEYYIKGETKPLKGHNCQFTAENQDLSANRKVNQRLERYGIKTDDITSSNWESYVDILALEWASFPYYNTTSKPKAKNKSWTPGQGYYPGQGGKYDKDELWLVYTLALEAYTNGFVYAASRDNLLEKINSKVGDSSSTNNIGSVNNLIKKYGELRPFGENMTDKDRLVDVNKNFIDKHIINWKVPSSIGDKIPVLRGRSIEMNKDFQKPLEKTLNDLIAADLHTEIEKFDGCFNIRKQRISQKISTHAYGMAIDFNADKNRLGGTVTFTKPFIDVWVKNGFTAGAYFKDRVDGMHYEYTKNLS